MGIAEYKKALLAAQKELLKLDAEAAVVALRRARLQQTVSTLMTLTNVVEQEERSLTDSIRIIIKAANGYIGAGDVLKAAESMGAKFSGKNPKASVLTILGRLVKDGEVQRQPGSIVVRFGNPTQKR